jgi:PAS domain S-box-containing protein
MQTKNNLDPEAVLRDWRIRILNNFLSIAAGIAVVMTMVTVLDAKSSPGLGQAVIVYLILTVAVVGLAAFRGIDYSLRAWCLLLICYIAGLATLATFGLGSSGRLYMLAVPILALILLGPRPGLIWAGVGTLTVVMFAILAGQGALGGLFVRDRNSLLLSDWLAESVDTLGILFVVMVLLTLFYRFQKGMISEARRAQGELFRAQSLLEEQNATLEQKVQERTGELLASNTRLQQRNAELALLTSIGESIVRTLDVRAMTRLVGDKLREVFVTNSVLILLLDRHTDLIHILYEYDQTEGRYLEYVEPFPLGTGLSSRVIQSREPLLLGTLGEEIAHGAYFPPEIIEKGSSAPGQSWLGVPILANEKVLGLVALADDQPHAFGENHLKLLQTLCSNLGIALENARLFDATQRLLEETEQRNRELAIINRLQEALASKLDLHSIFELIGEKVCEVFQVQVVDIVTYDAANNLISMPYSYEKGDRSVITPREPYGFRLHVIQSRAPLLINEKFEELATQHNNPILTGAWPRSALFMPLLTDGDVKGIISIQDLDRENAFNDSDVRLLQTLANAMSVAIENARLFDETQRLLKETEQRAAELAIINSVQAGLASKLDMQGIYELVGEKIRETFHAQVVSITTYERATQRMVGRYYFEDGNKGPGLTFPAFGFRKHVVDHHRTFVINEDMPRRMAEYDNPIHQGDQPKSAIFIPMLVGAEPIGVISLQNMDREHAFSDSDVRLLETLANSMSVALENARLFDETQHLLKETEQRAAELATVNTVSSAIASELDLQTLIQLVGEQIRSIYNADIAYVALLEKESSTVTFPYQYGQQLEPMLLGEGLTSRIIQSGQALWINQQLARQRQQLGVAQLGRQARSYLGVPIFVGGQAIGAISVQNTAQENAFTENDQHLLSTIAANVGIAMQNARFFDEIKRQQQYTQETQRRLADIINFLPDATLVIDSVGKVIAWNRAIEEMTGIPADQMIGRGNHEYALPFYGERRPILIDLVLKPREEIEEQYAQLQWNGDILTGEAYTPALKERGRYLYATASALHDAQGNTVGAIETIRDITDRKHAEEELKKARASAEQANQAKSAFLANMSHELRTPLNAIIGFTRIVRRKAEGVLPEKQTENLEKVLTSAEHLLNLINTVLDIAKIEAGRMDVLAANFRIGALMDLCANTAQPLLRPGVTLEKQVEERLNIVHSDQDKIRQILLNLLSNAAKFTHQGSITLAARQEGENLQVSVCDTGIGISPEALPRIFREFQQADTSTTRQYGGTGLGLSISRNLARLLGGDLNVESEPGKGSTFMLVVPMHYGTKAVSRLEEEPAPRQDTIPPLPRSTKKHILVIDDDPDAVYLLQENLNPQEFEILGARNGEDGMRMARLCRPQAILLDIVMPGTDGWQVLHDLKADPLIAGIPVVFLTIVDKKALGLQLGAAAYLLKPLDPVEVQATLRRVIGEAAQSPTRVLVVDDDPNIADMLRQCLPEGDFRLDSALDEEAGLRTVEQHPPDILLLDLIMPHLDGFGVIERLRANPRTQDLPIIVLSARDLSAAEQARLKETVALVMKKQGFEGATLVEAINELLKQEGLPA